MLATIVAGLVAVSWFGGRIAKYSVSIENAAGRFGSIDGLRGYLALAVVAHHFMIWTGIVSAGRSWEAPPENWANQLGTGSVAMFFMATGFLFYPNIRAGPFGTRWFAFYIKRVFRLVPLTLFSVGLVTIVIAFQFETMPRRHFFVDLAFWLSGWQPGSLLGIASAGRANAYVLWSLWYEWVFYLFLVPLFSLLSAGFGRQLWLLPVLVVAVSVGARHSGSLNPIWMYLPMFACGMLVRQLVEVPRLVAAMKGRSAAVLGSTALAATMFGFHEPHQIALVGLAVFFAVVASGNTLFGVLETRGAALLGSVSFGIYLLHGLIFYVWFTLISPISAAVPAWIAFPFLSGMTVALAYACHVLIERPAISAGHKIVNRWFSGKLANRTFGLVGAAFRREA